MTKSEGFKKRRVQGVEDPRGQVKKAEGWRVGRLEV
jgi:hypothetical protein